MNDPRPYFVMLLDTFFEWSILTAGLVLWAAGVATEARHSLADGCEWGRWLEWLWRVGG